MTDNPGDTYCIDMRGGVHSTAQECIEANLAIEESNSGAYPAGGNCGQTSEDVPKEKE